MTCTGKPTLVPIGTPNLMDVPAALRRLAGELESGDEPGAVCALVVLVDADGEIVINGYGKVGTAATIIGNLHLAMMQLIRGSDE